MLPCSPCFFVGCLTRLPAEAGGCLQAQPGALCSSLVGCPWPVWARLTLAGSHCLQQAVWKYLPSVEYTLCLVWEHRGPLHVLKGSLCSVTWAIWQPLPCGADNAFTQRKQA